jgi:hypothetical protein
MFQLIASLKYSVLAQRVAIVVFFFPFSFCPADRCTLCVKVRRRGERKGGVIFVGFISPMSLVCSYKAAVGVGQRLLMQKQMLSTLQWL